MLELPNFGRSEINTLSSRRVTKTSEKREFNSGHLSFRRKRQTVYSSGTLISPPFESNLII